MYRKSIGSPLHHLFNWTLYKETYHHWSADNAGRLAASLAYHSAMAAAPLIIGVLALVGLVYDSRQAQAQLVTQANYFIGSQGAQTINTILANADQPELAKWAGILSLILLLWSASNIFVQLQDSLNTVWGVQLRPDLPFLRKIQHRVLPLLVVLGIGALLLVAVIASAALTAVAAFLSGLLPAGAYFWQIANFLISLAVITLLFALIFKYLPDVKIRWPDLWPGSLLTGILFVLGQFVLGWYLGRQSSASVYGAAGSLIVLLLWLYYSAQIFLFGAEFTQVYATRYGHGVLPAKDAVAREINVPDKPAAQAATAGVMEESDAEEPQAATAGVMEESDAQEPQAATAGMMEESDTQEPQRSEVALDAPPLRHLVTGPIVDGSTLFKQERALAKAEFRAKLAQAGGGVGLMTGGGTAVYAAIFLGLLSVALLLSRITPLWLALLLVGALVPVEGWLVRRAVRHRVATEKLLPMRRLQA